jgi:hypothetical protein
MVEGARGKRAVLILLASGENKPCRLLHETSSASTSSEYESRIFNESIRVTGDADAMQIAGRWQQRILKK